MFGPTLLNILWFLFRFQCPTMLFWAVFDILGAVKRSWDRILGVSCVKELNVRV